MIPEQEQNHDLLQSAIRAIERGDLPKGQALLRRILHYDPQNEMAWLWLAVVVPTQEQRVECLEQVLAINPENRAALETLREITQFELPPEETIFQRHDIEAAEDLPGLEDVPEVVEKDRSPDERRNRFRKPQINLPRFRLPHLKLPTIAVPAIDLSRLWDRLLHWDTRLRNESPEFETPILDEFFLPVDLDEYRLQAQIPSNETEVEAPVVYVPATPGEDRPVYEGSLLGVGMSNRTATYSQDKSSFSFPRLSKLSNQTWGKVGISIGGAVFMLGMVLLLIGLNIRMADNLEIRQLQEFGIVAPATVEGLTVFEEAPGSRYVVTYQYRVRLASGDLQTFRRQDDIRYETFARLAHHLPLNIRYLPMKPDVARFETELVAAPEMTGVMLRGLGLAFSLLGTAIILAGVAIWLRAPLHERLNKTAGGVVVDKWSETNVLGQPVYHLAYQFEAYWGKDGHSQVFYRGVPVSPDLYRVVKLGTPVGVRYLPTDPSTSDLIDPGRD